MSTTRPTAPPSVAPASGTVPVTGSFNTTFPGHPSQPGPSGPKPGGSSPPRQPSQPSQPTKPPTCKCVSGGCNCAQTGCTCTTDTGCVCGHPQPPLPPPSSGSSCSCATTGCKCPPTACTCGAPQNGSCGCPSNSTGTGSSTGQPPHGIQTGGVPSWYDEGCGTIEVQDDTNTTGGSGTQSAVVTTGDSLWAIGAVITYTFKDGDPSQRNKVMSTITEWENYANIHFQYTDLPTAVVRISFAQGKGTSTRGVGTVILDNSPDVTTMYLASVLPGEHVITTVERSSILHEFGHVLGLYHEHQSPARGSTITIKEDVAIKYYQNTNMELQDEAKIKKQITDRLMASVTSNFSMFDPSSIMLYPIPAELTVEGIEILDPAELSDMDKAFVSLNYPYTAQQNAARGTIWTVDYALNVVGVTEDYRAKILTKYNANDYAGMREELADYIIFTFIQTYNPQQPSGPSQPANPSHDVGPQTDGGTDVTTGSFLDVLLNTLTDLFAPTTGQIFALQFPGRFLDQSQYAWDTSSAGIYGQFVKPTVVNESEFRLVDQLYNVGTVVGAPNGINLSIVYQQCLNNLLPGFQSATSIVAQQQDQIRQWLLKEVPVSGWVSDLITAQHAGAASSSPIATSTTGAPTGAASGVTGSSSAAQGPQFSVSNKLDGNSVNRMELAQALMEEYLSAKQAWELERDNMIQSATPSTLADVTRNLSHITAIRESQLASKYADAVVRGYSHVIRQYMGYMDIKSPAESLQDAKDALRESGSSSLDGSLTVYPVQMQPIDWFQSLSTSFTLEDLTSDPALIDQQIDAKSKQLDVLNSRLAALQLNPKIDMTALQAQLDAAQQQYDNAQATLSSTYSNEVISLAKSCVSSVGDFLFPAFETLAVTYNIAETTYSGIDTSMGNITAAQKAVTQASRAYSQLLAQKALASATDTQNEQTQITLDINSLTKDLDELTARRQALRTPQATDATGAPIPAPPSSTSINDVVLLPPNTQAGGSRWQDIVMHHNLTTQFSSQSSASSGSTSQTNIGLFLFNQSSSSSSSGATSSNQSGDTSYDVQVGFRATLVTVDRSGWFQPQFFKQSNGFYHIDDTVSWSKWPAGITTLDDLKKADATVYDAINKYMLPAYPVGFIICKDITIKIAMTATQISSDAANFQQTLAKSRGILCFSTSSAETSTSSQNSYNFTSASDGIIIRIPGPQILGYYLQLTDNDQTQPLPATLPDGFLISDADYDSGITNAAQPTTKTQ